MSNNRLGLFEIKTSSLAEQRTDLSRSKLFLNDQSDWIRNSINAENEIAHLFANNKTLFDLYEYARKERERIALKHEYCDVGSFWCHS